MRILVTGGSGFLGRAVIAVLAAHGHEVAALVRSGEAARTVSALDAEALPGDLDEARSVDDAFCSSKAEILVNVASLGFGHAPAITAAAVEAGIPRAVFLSTTAIFTTLPAASKAVRVDAERTVEASGLDWTIIRPTMIYGTPGDRNMSRLLAFLRRSPVAPLPGGGRRLIQPVHVDDLASFVVTAAETDAAIGQAFNVAGPDALTLRQVVAEAAGALGKRTVLVPIPLYPVVAAVKVYEKLASTPRLKLEQVLRLDEDKAFDIGPARRLGYSPRTFSEGIKAEARLLA
jgi:uncharacterized protein YbjT (DUF2867 family)